MVANNKVLIYKSNKKFTEKDVILFIFIFRALLKTQKSRLSKFLKFEFTTVNEYFNNFV